VHTEFLLGDLLQNRHTEDKERDRRVRGSRSVYNSELQ
jgi:hypothetical protein